MAQLIAALMRHGAYHQPAGVLSAHLPYPLTAQGAEDARLAAGALLREATAHGWQLDPVIDSSSLLRAWETAESVAREIGEATGSLPRVESFDALAERSVGSAANLTESDIEKIVACDPRREKLPPNWKRDSAFRLPFPGAESLIEAGERVARHLKSRMSFLAEAGNQRTLKLFVGHGGAFRHAAVALGVMTADEARARTMTYGGIVYLEAIPHGRWRHVAGAWKMRDERSTRAAEQA